MTVTLEMVSDLVCPWCWLGLRRIRRAMELVPDVEVNLLFRPYELDPTIPMEGVDYKAYSAHAFSSDAAKERARMMRNALVKYGEEEDVPFDFENITTRPNSLNAHRVVRWAQGQGKAADAKEALFSAFFSDGRDIGNTDVLIDIAASVGLDASIVGDLLASDADIAAVRKEEDAFREMGVAGVPTYIANRRLAIQGAESVEKLSGFLTTAAAHMPKERGLAGNA